MYAHEGSIYRQVPIGVVVPRDTADVVAAVDVCRHHQVPILGRGCGTSLAGQCVNRAVVIDCSKYMNDILELDVDGRTARVQPGVICDHLRNTAEADHLTFGPDPATHDHATLGGMIGNNSCGTHSVMAGKTVDNVIALEVVTYDGLRLTVGRPSDDEVDRLIGAGGRTGEIYAGLRRIRDTYGDLIRSHYPKIPRRVSGYNLDSLLPEYGFDVAKALVGSESTCVLVLEATLRLVPSPPHRALLVLGYPDVPAAGHAVPELMAYAPIALEHFDRSIIEGLERKGMHKGGAELLPRGNAWLLMEFGGESEEAYEQARRVMAAIEAKRGGPRLKLCGDAAEESLVWEIRRSSVGASRIPGEHGGWPNWEDAAVAPERLGDYLSDYIELCKRHNLHPTFYGHFGQGCVHSRLDWKLRTADGVREFRRFMEEAADLVVSYGGSLSGEHGDGHGRAELLPRMYGHELMQAMAEFKRLWDPDGRMNPGKIVNAYRLDQHLVEHPQLRSVPVTTHFAYPDDQGSFFEATGRCFGVGRCRHTEGGTMCPSFMATREEQHSTRGRARLLFEMMQTAGPLGNPWRSEPVKEALDLCLACKGCKGECPVRVDMATYKAEFLAHYYAGRLRPRSAYALGLIYWWSRAASHAPGLANAMTHAPLLGRLAKYAGGIAQQRDVPRFAAEPFRSWYRKRGGSKVDDGPEVILWPDTFNNYFHPEVARSAVEVLEAARVRVIVPNTLLCCGRPLYDYGMLPTAKRLLSHVVDTLRTQIRDGVPVVGLEPSCLSVFRDELRNLFPHDEDAIRLSQQTFMLSEFLVHRLPDYRPPRLQGTVLLHGHCHDKSVLDFDAEKALLERMGLSVEAPESGCCGLAGSFGYEAGDKYRVSMTAAERVLLPAVRTASADTYVVTDGFSCSTQISTGTGRRPLHVAELLHQALERQGALQPLEIDVTRRPVRRAVALAAATAVTAGAGALVAARRAHANG